MGQRGGTRAGYAMGMVVVMMMMMDMDAVWRGRRSRYCGCGELCVYLLSRTTAYELNGMVHYFQQCLHIFVDSFHASGKRCHKRVLDRPRDRPRECGVRCLL